MDRNSFTQLLSNTNNISTETVSKLEAVMKRHPYFQSAQTLLLKGLKENNNYKYNKALKTTAAITVDRTVLFDYINNFKLLENKPEQKFSISRKTEDTTFKEEKDLEIGAPLNFGNTEVHSFNQWLQLTNKKPINRGAKRNSTLLQNINLIDNFIDNNPTIKPIAKESQNSFQLENNYSQKELMTETLAKVYLEQKKYSNAIQAYEILILKYPEKSGFFADQIKKIEYLKNK